MVSETITIRVWQFVFFIENVYEKINDNKFTAGIYLDLRKAFDVIDHNILLKKLENYEVRGVTFDLFRKY